MSATSSLEQALAYTIEELDREAIPYMLIGGLALSAWGLPRATVDIDLTLWTETGAFERVCAELALKFVPLIGDPLSFARRTRVLPAAHKGVRIDFVFAAYPFEKKMIQRAQQRAMGDLMVSVSSLEDLILLKLPSPRAKDREDVNTILAAYRRKLDWDYLLAVGGTLSEALEQPELRDFLERARG